MPLIPRLVSLWHNLLHKNRVEQEFTEEIQAYLEMLIEAKTTAGLTPEEARRAALIELGGMEQVKERVREVRMGYFLETLWQDLRYGMRVLVRARSSLRWLWCRLRSVSALTRLSSVSSTAFCFGLCPTLTPSG